MKKILILALLTVGLISNAQEKEFKFDKSGLTDYIVIDVPNKTKTEIYDKVINWIKTTYKNPESVIVSEIKDEYVKIQGATDNRLVNYKTLGMTSPSISNRYRIEISVKDGKYKFDVIRFEYYEQKGDGTTGEWYDYGIGEDTDFRRYDKKGNAKSFHKKAEVEMPKYFNELNKSLLDYINSSETTNSKKDW